MRSKRPKRRPALFTLHIVSDATGLLARHAVNNVLTQFPSLDVKQVYHTFIDSEEDIAHVVAALRRKNTLVLYGLIDPKRKTMIHNACRQRNIPSYDLIGSLVQFIADHTGTAPVNKLSRLHETNEGYFQRIAAMEFTAQHDDGMRLDSLDQADIIIVGLSRVSKSPTATFLGSMGYKVANVSITQETGFPPELKKMHRRVIAFTAAPKFLQETRARRFHRIQEKINEYGIEDLPYYDMRPIVREVVYAEREFRKRSYPIVDIVGKTVEELSAIVLKELNIQQKNITYQDCTEES